MSSESALVWTFHTGLDPSPADRPLCLQQAGPEDGSGGVCAQCVGTPLGPAVFSGEDRTLNSERQRRSRPGRVWSGRAVSRPLCSRSDGCTLGQQGSAVSLRSVQPHRNGGGRCRFNPKPEGDFPVGPVGERG